MFSFVIAAAAAAAQPSPADLQDLRCIAAIGALSAMVDKPDQKEKLVAGMLYFVGKIDGRSPGFDYQGQLAALAAQPDFSDKQLLADAMRCGEELKTRGDQLQKLGKALEGKKPGT
ncbi:MAG: hypothetical protein GXC70_09225 [Sphingomonadaceae bacterium]|nr:hypothetical protein [Sphingomonadaceae bacterium]